MPDEMGERDDGEAFAATTADRIVGSLQSDERLVKGSDPDAPVAGLLAAAAAVPGARDEVAYRPFVGSWDRAWPAGRAVAAREAASRRWWTRSRCGPTV